MEPGLFGSEHCDILISGGDGGGGGGAGGAGGGAGGGITTPPWQWRRCQGAISVLEEKSVAVSL